MKIGITGGIGSGKSYVCQRLIARGYEVYDCDSAAKRLMRSSPEIRQQLTSLIGPDTYLEVKGERGEVREYTLNKKKVAEFLLVSEDNAKAIDAIVHPAVFCDFEASGMKWMESAILYESGAYRLVDKTIVVTAPEEVRIQRVMQRDGISREKVLEWMARQLPQEEVRRRADFEIINDGEANIEQQLNKILRNMKETILAIAGKPGLYKLVSRGKNNLIVEALDATHRRQPAFATDRITSLNDIAMFTETDDVPLMTVLDNMKNLEDGQKASINEKKASGKELQDYFTKVLPEWDRDRVQNSHIKKLITWYNILIENGITDFKTEETEETKEEASE
ncbi:MAG: dephospho-CoA kinase [Prevotella sp.]|nr:dephospho-CoA kinase [Prevotella sp.]